MAKSAKKGGKKPAAKGKGKGKKKGATADEENEEEIDETKITKFKKGVFNPAVKIVDHYEFLEST